MGMDLRVVPAEEWWERGRDSSLDGECDLGLMVTDFLETGGGGSGGGGGGGDSWCSSDSDSGFPDPSYLSDKIQFLKYSMPQHETEVLSAVRTLMLSIKEKDLHSVKSGTCNASCIRFYLAKLLRLSGYNAAVCSARWQGTGKVPGGDNEYVDIILSDTPLGQDDRLIIDIDFRSHFEIARAVDSYQRIMESLPVVYVGTVARLNQFLQAMVDAAGSLAIFLCVLLMLACCQALSSNVDDGYGHEDGSFETDSLIKLNNDDDVLTLKSSDRPTTESSTVSVSNFGAKGDGKTDDTQAFKKAWKKACSTNGVTTFLIPKGKTYLLKSIRFRGPCKSLRSFQILGTLSASTKRSDYSNDKNHWLILEDVNNLSIDGGSAGIVDGNGKIWWQNSCKIDKSKPCTKAPTALTLYNLNNLNVKNLRVRNAQQIQISIEKCNSVDVKNVKITAPGDSPNTDGIHIVATKNIRISNSDIGTGDDCISIEDGSQNVQINDLTCGPGHGISIGSLGDDNSKAYVSGINVDGATLSETDNGVRIKTYQGGSGTAKNIKFQNIRMDNVKNPIIIDQNYCDKDKCEQQESAVQVNNVVYRNIQGTSATDVAIMFNCSVKYPCQGIVLENVNIKGGKASCKNVNVKDKGTVSPKCP